MAKKQTNKEKLHELEAERNALNNLLRDALIETVAHIGHVLGALLLNTEDEDIKELHTQLDKIETLDKETLEAVKLYGETTKDISIKSKFEQWRERISEIETEIAELTNTPH